MKTARQFLGYFPEMRFLLVGSVIAGSIVGILPLFQAIFLSQIIVQVFLGSQSLKQVWPSLLTLLALLVLRACATGGNILLADCIAAYIKKEMRARLLTHLFALGPAYTQRERSGELVSTLVEGSEALVPYCSQYLPQVFLACIIPVLMVTVLCCIDLPSGIIILFLLPLLPFLLVIAGMMARAETRRHWRALSLLSAHFLDTLQGLPTLKLCAQSQRAEQEVRQTSEQFRITTMKTLRVAFFSSFLLEESATVSTAVVAVEVGMRLLLGQVPLQTALLLLLLTPEVFLPLRLLGTSYHAGLSGSVALKRLIDILQTPIAAQKAREHSFVHALQGNHQTETILSLKDVSYAYEAQRPALHQISLQIRAGEKVALVGPSGAGKSTLVHLLLRFIEAESGQILLQGKLAAEMTPQEWRAQIAWVPQHPYLFQGTIAENICLGNRHAAREQMLQAAQLAQIDGWIKTLPQGYETIIGERGARLSGGEAQRISIARAFLKNAPLLILDEATSYLDAGHEELVQGALARLKQGRTVLIVAHRLHTVRDADQIIVLEKGKIVACGNHQVLIQQSNLYYHLVQTTQQRMEQS